MSKAKNQANFQKLNELKRRSKSIEQVEAIQKQVQREQSKGRENGR